MKRGSRIVSLKVKILATLLVNVGVIAAVAMFEMHTFIEETKKDRLGQLQTYADLLDDQIGAQFFERYGDVQAFALNPVLQNDKNVKAISDAFNQYSSLSGIYDLILYVDTSGHYIASNTLNSAGNPLKLDHIQQRNYAEESWFKAAMAGNFTEDRKRGFVGTYFDDAAIDSLVSEATGTQAVTTGFTTTVKSPEGKVIGVLTNRANFKYVEFELQVANENLSHAGLGFTQYTLLNKDGLIIAEYDGEKSAGKTYERDFDTVFKLNLLETKNPVAAELHEGKSGNLIVWNKRKNIEQVTGYQTLVSAKFIPSIGWGAMVRAPKAELLADADRMQRNFVVGVLVCFAAFFAIGWFVVARVAEQLAGVSDKLKESGDLSTKTSEALAHAAEQVAEASTEQSAAVQETVSSMSEISSMIAQTNQHVKECTSIAEEVTEKSESGHQTMRRLASTMESVTHANAQLQNIANIISEVSAKTAVINDIVFKTQLLSINASIEAARAGQHGKGFSVVAEEVGNLATTSGAAAKEIQLLISDSQKQVAQIVEVTQARAREGQSVASEALASFSEIAEGIQSINSRLQGVAQASREQETGIQQINTAMTYMDQTTQRNSGVATEASTLARQLGQQSRQMDRITRALRTVVMGTAADRPDKKVVDVVDQLLGDDQKDQVAHSGLPERVKVAALEDVAGRVAARLVSGSGGSGVSVKSASLNQHRNSPSKAEEQLTADDPGFAKSA